MATRLTRQFIRLAVCLAAVIQAPSITPDVQRRMRKVAVDTSRGKTMDIAAILYKTADKGLPLSRIVHMTYLTDARTRSLLRFMREVGLAEFYEKHGTFWRLNKAAREVYGRMTRSMETRNA